MTFDLDGDPSIEMNARQAGANNGCGVLT